MDSKGIRRLYLPLRPQGRFSSGRKTPAKFVGPSTGLRRLIVSRFKCGDGERYRSSLSIWGCFGWSFSDIFLRASEWLFINFNIQKSILVICQELFVIDFDMFFRKKVTLTDLRYALHETECQFDSILYSASSFSPVYSWFLTSNPKTSRTNLRDVSASALLC